MKPIRLAVAALVALTLTLVAACGSVPPPDTFAKKLHLTYYTLAGARDATATMLTAGKISVADARNLQLQADMARSGLDIARTMYLERCPQAAKTSTTPTLGVAESTCTFGPAEDKLSMTLDLVRALNAYLAKLQQGAPQ
jgi:hypothetical protein